MTVPPLDKSRLASVAVYFTLRIPPLEFAAKEYTDSVRTVFVNFWLCKFCEVSLLDEKEERECPSFWLEDFGRSDASFSLSSSP